MNGAESLVRTMVGGGVTTCFANPGTSEMHFVAALDRIGGMRSVLCLFEGVVTGAADGYGRMTERPAATLLHLGPGLANASANIHNARRAFTPMVNVVGEHATYHIEFDAPLTSDIVGVARPFSDWVRTGTSAATIGADGAAAIAASLEPPGRIATLILPANTAWDDGGEVASVPAPVPRRKVSADAVRAAAQVLRSGEPALLLLTGRAVRAEGLQLAGRIAAKTGADVLAQTSNGRIERGAGRFSVDRVPYPVPQALERLQKFRHIVLVGAKEPIGFFAYPGKPSRLSPEGCNLVRLSQIGEDSLHALEWLADEVGARSMPFAEQPLARPALPTAEKIDASSLATCLGVLLPENCIVVDESISTGRGLFPFTRGAPPHDWLQVTGGSIGLGLPMAVGAAVACPERRVVCLEGDGSAMYTLQALWTMARESLDVTVVLLSNRSYAILVGELANVGAGNPGRVALDMLDLRRPDLNWVGLARSMGVPATRAETNADFVRQFAQANATAGPGLIEVVL